MPSFTNLLLRSALFTSFATLCLLSGSFPAAARAQAPDTLTHGPVIGAVTASSARVFVRTLMAAQVRLRYGTDATLATALESETVSTTIGNDFTAQIELEGLKPQTRYYLAIVVDDVLQTGGHGQFKTFPPIGNRGRAKFVILSDFGSVGEGEQPPLAVPSPTFAHAAAENPDFVFIGGDFDHRNARTLQDREQMFKDLYALGNPRAPMDDFVTKILSAFPLAHQWDDHDYAANDSDRFATDRGLAKQVFTEYFPAYPYGGAWGISQQFSYGKADLFILDNRSERDPDAAPDSETKSMLDGEHLGAAGQLAWLKRGLRKSTATWKVIFSSSVFNTTMGKIDSWRSFKYEHDEIVNFVKSNRIGGVFVISGDIHMGAMDDGRNAGLPLMVVPGVNLMYCAAVPVNGLGKWSNGTYGESARASNGVPCNGYGVVKLKAKRAALRVKNEKGLTKLKLKLSPEFSE